jgi:hypothetical protein
MKNESPCVSTVLGEGAAQDPLVIRERLAVAISQLLEQLCGPLDVGKQEGDGADRQLVDRAHARSVSPPCAKRTQAEGLTRERRE